MSELNIGELEATEERKLIVQRTLARMCVWVKGRKLPHGTLTKDATEGFNLACDFLAHELEQLQAFHNKDILE